MASPSSLLLRLVLSSAFIVAAAVAETFPGDVEALRLIKEAVDPASVPSGSCLASWDFSADPCAAAYSDRFTCGLRCDAADAANLSRVTEVALDSAAYSGRVPASVWSLPFLETLDLTDNRFYGEFPSPPASFSPASSRLRRLTLTRNLLSGRIPNLSPVISLQEVYLDGNFFAGEINSTSLSELRLLRRLEVQGNNLTGEIPDLTPLTSLNYLDASDNRLTGGFPDNRLPASLVEVSVRNNRLAGEVQGEAVAGLPSLQVLDLSGNALRGAAPAALFEHPALEQLTMSRNELERIEAPAGEGVERSQLVEVDLGHNRLTGLLPGFVGSMRRLAAVDLGDNRFNGMIPAQYAARVVGAAEGMARFGRLVLAGNYLFGPIPGAMMGGVKEGEGTVSLADNCLFWCPSLFFFCEDGRQKPSATCREFNPVIP